MQLFCYVTVAFGLTLLLSAGNIQETEASSHSRPRAVVDVAISDAIARKVLSFALQLKKQLINNTSKVVVFSPVSVMSALAIIMIACKGVPLANLTELFGQSDVKKMHQQFGLMLKDVVQPIMDTTSPLRKLDPWNTEGLTAESLKEINNVHGSQSVLLATAIFLQNGHKLKSSKRREITDNYHPDILHVNFEERPELAADAITSWINHEVNVQVDKMIGYAFDPDMDKVIVTILTLKATWETSFVADSGKYNSFYRDHFSEEKPVHVPMMTATASFPYYLSMELKCHIIGIPYEGEMTTMYVIKPINSSVTLLDEFNEKLTADDIEGMIKKMRRRRTTLVMPKMSFDVSLALRTPLEQMGLSSIFAPLNRLKRHKITSRKKSLPPKEIDDLTVTQIYQKMQFKIDDTTIEVSDGTLGVDVRSGPATTFLANEPFILLVRNDLTKLPLIYGVINEPVTDSI